MDKTRLWIIGSVLLMVVVAALGWIVGVQPQLDQATAASAQTAEVESGNAAKAAVLATMKKDNEDLSALKKQLTSLQASIPSKEEWPAFGDELNTMAAAAGVTIVSVVTDEGQAYALPAAPAAATPAAGSAGGSAATPAPTPTPGPTAAATATPAPATVAGAPPVTSPLITSANFTLVPVSVTVRGDEKQILQFVHASQTGTRLLLVNGLKIAPSSEGLALDAKVSGYLYVLGNATEVNKAE
jgi:Tfp pilus assembly protein PilO